MSTKPESPTHENAEQKRLHEERERLLRWKHWGPYLSERAWGTVREDYSASGDAWAHFPHDHARSRAYRWNEDGLAGLCDRHQLLCLSLALWNGEDPILKERLFGLTGPEGNHGEDVKELYYYEDATPTASYLRFLYKYPQRAYPYDALLRENARRGPRDPELELPDLGLFADNRYFDVTVEYAKYSPTDILMVITAENRADSPAPLHLLPQAWFRNTWSWSDPPGALPDLSAAPPAQGAESIRVHHDDLGPMHLYFESASSPSTDSPSRDHHSPSRDSSSRDPDSPSRGSLSPDLLFTHNETNTHRLWGSPSRTPHVKDAFHERVIRGDLSAVNPARHGTKAAAWYRFDIPPRSSVRIRVRLTPDDQHRPFEDADTLLAQRRREADEYYLHIQGKDLTDDRRAIHRQASAGLFWGLQFYNYDVSTWLDGDAIPPPDARRRGRNREWRHLSVADIISMPDKWEYPWFAAWDLAFHALAMASVDIDQAKAQLKLLVKEWYQHPNGQIPAYEWEFSDLNPPVQAWATYQIYKIERRQRGEGDRVFLERMFHKLLINFAWWVNKRDAEGNNVFEGGFLGLDNISLFDRSEGMPPGVVLEQADATAWMAMYCLDLMRIALELALTNTAYEDVASKFFEHFARIVHAMNHGEYDGDIPLWSEADGFYFDLLKDKNTGRERHHRPQHGRPHPALRSTSSPARPAASTTSAVASRVPRQESPPSPRPSPSAPTAAASSAPSPSRLPVSSATSSTSEFLSPTRPPAPSPASTRPRPVSLWLEGMRRRGEVSYEPGESTTRMKGGNSNWRGPVWLPTGYLLYRSPPPRPRLRRRASLIPQSGQPRPHSPRRRRGNRRAPRPHLRARLDGRRPVYGQSTLLQTDPAFADKILYELLTPTPARARRSHQTG
ncbi:MAG: glucosidase [Polyangiaceae bacterium]